MTKTTTSTASIKAPKADSSCLSTILAAHDITRRGFLKLCASLAATAGVVSITTQQVAEALEQSVIGVSRGKLYPVIWMEGASCTGCTESLNQASQPDVSTVVLEILSTNYFDALAAGAGQSAMAAMYQTIDAGRYILIYEGAVLEGWDGHALRVADQPGTVHLEEAARHADLVIAVGSCAVNGGWMAARPNPSQAIGVQQYLEKVGIDTPVINIPGCPANPEWMIPVLLSIVLMGQPPMLDSKNKPSMIFQQTVHDNCKRRNHYENGRFVYEFGSTEEVLGYCLYPMGCRGLQTNANCAKTRWNNGRSWCVDSGSPCIGCCTADPNDTATNWVDVNTPFYRRPGDVFFKTTLRPETLAIAAAGLAAASLIIGGFGMKISAFKTKLKRRREAEADTTPTDTTPNDSDPTDSTPTDSTPINSTPSDDLPESEV
ncbi:MAG: hydrogenase small subunit [Coriobacteriales bacterium]|jgi:hydrogenase small subunit|nr:hydrogenase small subunit [Coriobacteriales bacterium]